MTGPSTIPNPHVYLNYLTPGDAKEFEIARNIYLVTLGALLWDVLACLPRELSILRIGLRPSTLAYFISRISSMGFAIMSVIEKTHGIPHCQEFEHGVTSLGVLAICSTSFLFLHRLCTVFDRYTCIRCMFSCLWILNVGVSIVIPLGAQSEPLSVTGYCIVTEVKRYIIASALATFVFETLAFVFISYELARDAMPFDGVTGYHRRGTMARLRRAFFQVGQQYYLAIISAHILVSVLIMIPSVPTTYHVVFVCPYMALASSMTCRAFRVTSKTPAVNMNSALARTKINPGKKSNSKGFSMTMPNRSTPSTASSPSDSWLPYIGDLERGGDGASIGEMTFKPASISSNLDLKDSHS